jgi:hypothetical protein
MVEEHHNGTPPGPWMGLLFSHDGLLNLVYPILDRLGFRLRFLTFRGQQPGLALGDR